MDEVITNLKRRYLDERAIYTWCGIALVAVNPYQEQHIYGEQVVETYHSASHSVYLQLDPHIYAVTEDAYSKLELHQRNQSIIVSGESGAGKTVSAKHAMRYLASIASPTGGQRGQRGQASSKSNKMSAIQKSIEQRVLASNPIMEAIGNARTVRNDNSSRFGKYIQIYFDRQHRRILGANMRTYLLEKSRVSKQQVGERNYHIFYQLLSYAQRHPAKMAHLRLLEGQRARTADDDEAVVGAGGPTDGADAADALADESPPPGRPLQFDYLSTGQMPSSSDLAGASPATASRDDLRRFNEALRTLSIDEQRIQIIYSTIAGILHGGNIKFVNKNDELGVQEDDDSGCKINSEADLHFQACCDLIGLEPRAMAERLTTRLLRSGPRDVIEKPQTRQQAEFSRDAMLKLIYECLFTWLVALINVSLDSREARGELGDSAPKQATPAAALKSPSTKKSVQEHLQQMLEPQFIGVLDIYGFENFQTNSFEQFCINYANEVLQQQYNQHVFKLEQEEYMREGIDWTFIEYCDNQPVIDLIESRPIGILSLLDEECKMPKGTDATWCAKLYEQLLEGGGGGGAKDQFKEQSMQSKQQRRANKTEEALALGDVRVPFKRPKLNSRTCFTICHYAEDVDYTVTGFLEKNRDSLAEEQCELLRSSRLLAFMLNDPLLAEQDKPRMRTARSTTVGCQFRGSLSALIGTLNATEPHYIRCIKPNDDKKAFEFNERRAIEQLRACGVYETIRISNNGFPSRWSYKDFAKRYWVLVYGTQAHDKLKLQQATAASSYLSSELVRPTCEAICRLAYDELSSPYRHLRTPAEQDYISTLIVRHGNKPSAIYQFGKSKIFFRAGQLSYLERVRSQRLREFSITIQRHVRGWLGRRCFARRREEYLEQLRREATLASLQEQARLQAELEAREAAELAAQLLASQQQELLEQEQLQQLQQQHSLQQADSLLMTQSQLESDAGLGHSHWPKPDSELASLYMTLVDLMYSSIQPLIISAVLEYEALDQPEPFMSLDSQCSSSSRSISPEQQFNEQSMENLIKELDKFHDLTKRNHVPQQICAQAFKQLFYLICAHSLNQLLIRRDLCQFRKAMQINFNLSCLVQWCRERYLVKWKEIVEQLDPITQATKLLQTRKSSDDIATIEEVCNKLRPAQIIKILNLYTSSYEEQITTEFIHELEEHLRRVRCKSPSGGVELLGASVVKQLDEGEGDSDELRRRQQQQQQQQQAESLEDENNNNDSANNFNQNDLLMDTRYFFPFVERVCSAQSTD